MNFQIKETVKAQQEKSDDKLKTLHKDMVVKTKKPVAASPAKKADKKKKAASVSTKPTRQNLGKLKV